MPRFEPKYIDGITLADWRAFAAAILSKGPGVENWDDMGALLRSVCWDSRIKEPHRFRQRHLHLAMSLLAMGRIDQIERQTR